MNKGVLLLFLLLHLLSSCSLRSIYSNNNVVLSPDSPLNFVEIAPIKSIEGAELMHHLSNLFPNSNNPQKYLLTIQLKCEVAPVAIQKNADALRQTLNQIVEYRLSDNNNNILTKGKFNHITSYAATYSPYASYIESEEALINLSKQAAEDIRTRLLLYFSKNSNL